MSACYTNNLFSRFILHVVYLSSLNIKTKLLRSAFFLFWNGLNFVFGFDVKILASCRKRAFIKLIDCFIRLLILCLSQLLRN